MMTLADGFPDAPNRRARRGRLAPCGPSACGSRRGGATSPCAPGPRRRRGAPAAPRPGSTTSVCPAGRGRRRSVVTTVVGVDVAVVVEVGELRGVPGGPALLDDGFVG